ncbi:low molecular weight protein-tyrosine-phosphatase domain-containing protein [Rhizobium etli bv. mimosae str. IE4771]|uniref:protein-tyrosine-phosphatase n=1 Tax=Rhizobium etli bv. mimosae str. IE4771 TaxID=1432050 RepID=A0A060I603_RHIET|nr:low molecular weight protein-tyrosine-phosphatase domain-containing protein [Rhizobium sp. IE4771]
MTLISILFVCMGNICRSPLAEGIFRHLVTEAGLTGHFTIDSAGPTGVRSPPHKATVSTFPGNAPAESAPAIIGISI